MRILSIVNLALLASVVGLVAYHQAEKPPQTIADLIEKHAVTEKTEAVKKPNRSALQKLALSPQSLGGQQLRREPVVRTLTIVKPKTPPTRCGGSERLWLTCAIYFEARNQSDRGQLMVALVILNRVEDPRWPSSVEGVVRQGEEKRNRCQFSFMCDGQSEHIMNEKAWRKAYHIAGIALRAQDLRQQVTCAHSYHADYVKSPRALRWFASLQKERQEETHLFYCDKNS